MKYYKALKTAFLVIVNSKGMVIHEDRYYTTSELLNLNIPYLISEGIIKQVEVRMGDLQFWARTGRIIMVPISRIPILEIPSKPSKRPILGVPAKAPKALSLRDKTNQLLEWLQSEEVKELLDLKLEARWDIPATIKYSLEIDSGNFINLYRLLYSGLTTSSASNGYTPYNHAYQPRLISEYGGITRATSFQLKYYSHKLFHTGIRVIVLELTITVTPSNP